jgi:hypothetical protein
MSCQPELSSSVHYENSKVLLRQDFPSVRVQACTSPPWEGQQAPRAKTFSKGVGQTVYHNETGAELSDKCKRKTPQNYIILAFAACFIVVLVIADNQFAIFVHNECRISV